MKRAKQAYTPQHYIIWKLLDFRSMSVRLHEKIKVIVKIGLRGGIFLPNYNAKESFIEISMDCNPMNQTTFVEKIPRMQILQKSYTIPLNQRSPKFNSLPGECYMAYLIPHSVRKKSIIYVHSVWTYLYFGFERTCTSAVNVLCTPFFCVLVHPPRSNLYIRIAILCTFCSIYFVLPCGALA